jgi:hypothetical protein
VPAYLTKVKHPTLSALHKFLQQQLMAEISDWQENVHCEFENIRYCLSHAYLYSSKLFNT